MRVTVFLFIFFIAASCFGKEGVVPVVEGKGFQITLHELKLLLEGIDRVPRKRILNDPFVASKYLKYLAEIEVFSRLAKEKGLDKDPVVKEKIKLSIKAILAKAYLDREVERRIKELKITDEDIREFYEANKDRFKAANGTYVPLKDVKEQIVKTIEKMKRKSVVQEVEEEAFKRFGVKLHPELLRLLSDKH